MAKLWLAKDFAAQKFEEPPWIVPGLVTSVGISLIFAHPKVGKSILCCQLADSLSTGTPFLGHEPRGRFKVLYVQSDLPEREWVYQLAKLGVASEWTTTWLEEGWLGDNKEFLKLGHQVRDEHFSLVILDSLTSIAPLDVDINEKQAARELLARINNLVGDRPCWLIHHKRKGSPGVVDHTSTSSAGNYGLGAGVSVLYDLSDKGLRVRGRFLSVDLPLQRSDCGLWVVPTKVTDKHEEGPYG